MNNYSGSPWVLKMLCTSENWARGIYGLMEVWMQIFLEVLTDAGMGYCQSVKTLDLWQGSYGRTQAESPGKQGILPHPLEDGWLFSVHTIMAVILAFRSKDQI